MNDKEIESVLYNLIGNIDENTFAEMKKNLEMFIQPNVSLFIPVKGQCPFALKVGHTHPSYTFIYYMQPINDFVVEGKHINYPLTNGACLSAMSPGIPHQEIMTDYFQSFIAIAVDKGFFETIRESYQKKKIIYKGEAFIPSKELIELLRMYMLELSHYKNPELISHLSNIIVHTVIRSLINDITVPTFFYNRAEIDKAIIYMNAHMEEKITIADLAKHTLLSETKFMHLFREITGETPICFLNRIRLDTAKILLQSGYYNITEIAQKCGFQSSSYFTSSFRKVYHLSPSEYAKKF